MSISSQQVQKLREMTGAGILDCKNALENAGGDHEKAIQILREKGKASAAKKAGRTASEGLVCIWISPEQNKGSLVELSCETDFVARTLEFQDFVKSLALHTGKNSVHSADLLLSQTLNGSKETIESLIKEKIGKLGENLILRKAVSLGSDQSFIGNYIHAPLQTAPDCGKLGVLVEVQTNKKGPELTELVKELCMQVAAASPKWVKKEDVPADIVEKEKGIYKEQCKQSGKPETAWPKIMEGKLNDFYKQFCLLEQSYIRDSSGKTPVRNIVQTASEKLGSPVVIQNFVRVKVGEE
jgi:elongation factor Ts